MGPLGSQVRRTRFPLPPLTEAELRTQVDQARAAVFPDWDDYSPQAQAAAQRYSRLSSLLQEMTEADKPVPHYNYYVKGAQA